jgi:hypothetical protein
MTSGFAAAIVVTAVALLLTPPAPGVRSQSCSPVGAKRYAPAGSARGDVDGDRVGDRVWIGRMGGRSAPCRWFLFAQSEARLRATPLRQGGLEANWGSSDVFPKLRRLVGLDRRPGAEILVALDGGASTTAYGVFSVRGSRLTRFRVPRAEFPNAFYDGGSGNRFAQFGCLNRGVLAQAQFGQEGNRFSGSREIYLLSGSNFQFVTTRRYREIPYAALKRFPELSARRFARCAR